MAIIRNWKGNAQVNDVFTDDEERDLVNSIRPEPPSVASLDLSASAGDAWGSAIDAADISVSSNPGDYIPTDGLAAGSWHIRDISGRGNDIRVEDVWPTYTGRGVKVGVYDEGVQASHPDLRDNYDSSLHQVPAARAPIAAAGWEGWANRRRRPRGLRRSAPASCLRLVNFARSVSTVGQCCHDSPQCSRSNGSFAVDIHRKRKTAPH